MPLLDAIAMAGPVIGGALWSAMTGLAFGVLAATLLTALAPARWRGGPLRPLFLLLNLLAGNVGHNRNRDDV